MAYRFAFPHELMVATTSVRFSGCNKIQAAYKKNMHSSHIRYIGVNECPLESEYRNANVAIRCIWKPLKQHSKKNALQIRMAQQRVAVN